MAQIPPAIPDNADTLPDANDCVIVPVFPTNDPTSPPAELCELNPETGPVAYDSVIVPSLLITSPPTALSAVTVALLPERAINPKLVATSPA
ncbi:hypothetical protein OKW41_003140 [Paraburkholderia sp. UCT70]